MLDTPSVPAVAAMLVLALLAGIANGASGIAFAQIMAAGLALVVEPRTAIALLSIMVPVTATVQMLHRRGTARVSAARLGPLLAGGLVGVPIGVALLTYLPPNTMALILGAFTLLFVAWSVRSIPFEVAPSRERFVAPLVGIVAGICNGAVGASGPVVASYLLVLGLPAPVFTFTASALFFSMSLFRLVNLTAIGQITLTTVGGGLLLLAPALAGQSLGIWLQGRLPKATFRRLVLALLALLAVGLIGRGLG